MVHRQGQQQDKGRGRGGRGGEGRGRGEGIDIRTCVNRNEEGTTEVQPCSGALEGRQGRMKKEEGREEGKEQGQRGKKK